MFRLISNSVRSVSRLPVCFNKSITKPRLTTQFCTAVKNEPVEVKPYKIIYEYNQPMFFISLNILGLTYAFIFTNFIQYYLKKVKTEVSDDEELAFPYFKNYKVNMKKFQQRMLYLFGFLACGAWIAVITYTTRSVRYILLRKGDKVTIVTYTPLGGGRAMTRSLKSVSGYRYRSNDVSYLPLRIKNKWFYYLIDMRGKFHEPEIFDKVINVSRTLQ